MNNKNIIKKEYKREGTSDGEAAVGGAHYKLYF